jgi:arylsulfatase
MPREIQWELYNPNEDRSETTDLAKSNPEVVGRLATEWEDYARRTGIVLETR